MNCSVIFAALLPAILVVGRAGESQGQTTISEIESRRSLGAVEPDAPIIESWQKGLARLHNVPALLRKAYRIPISVEGHPVVGRQRIVDYIPFKVQRNETLRHAVDKFENLVPGIYEWRWINGVPFIGPPLDKDGRTGTSFDTIVSLDLDSVSVWDAFVALAEAIWANNSSEFPLRTVQPQCTAELLAPPPEFVEPGKVTLNLSNVTAREAACAIINASPIEMYFFLVNSDEYDYLSLYFTEEGQPIPLDRMTDDEIELWHNEFHIVNPIFQRTIEN